MNPPGPDLATLCVRTIRMLAVDAIEAARSGHPGAPLGAADMAFVLWSRFLRFDPAAPDWPDRDRFVLSAGHASMLLYALLHLSGYDLALDEVRRFRQWGSRTAGHPERGLAPGVEVTTGPLGQGFAHAVGLELAGRMLQARYNDGGHVPISHRVFVLASDGDLMEGVSYEASSLAGHLGLGNLVVLYDSNRITIEGGTDLAFSDDVRQRFEAVGWRVDDTDGHDHQALARAVHAAVSQSERPSLIIAHTEIARGAPTLHGSHHAHGAPLGPEEVRAMKEAEGWPLDPPFHVPGEVRAWFGDLAAARHAERLAWERDVAAWRKRRPDLATEWDARFSRAAPDDLLKRLVPAALAGQGKATRVLSGLVLQEAARTVPGLAGGSADLAPSNQTEIQGAAHVVPSQGPDRFAGANLHFGVREHAMAAVVNGLAIHGGFRPYGGTFLVFADYMKPALRLAAMMQLPSIFVFTHDSFAVGEDGPTHQPVEHLWMLRSIPGMTVWRPADAVEVAAAWADALSRERGPVAIVLTRQSVAGFARREGFEPGEVQRGGYVVSEPDAPAHLTLAATGSEVSLAVQAAALLADRGVRARVASLPCLERFEAQPAGYRDTVLPPSLPVITVEAGSTVGWGRYTGRDGFAIGLDRFGASAPAGVLAREFGFTPEAVADRVGTWWAARRAGNGP